MKVTLAEIKALEIPLTAFLKEKLPLKASYRLSKVLKQISSELADLESERQKLIREYGDVDETNNEIAIKDEAKLIQFRIEFTELLKEEIELNYDPISLSELGDNIQLTLADMTYLSVLFKDD
jgi:hypothetical protein